MGCGKADDAELVLIVVGRILMVALGMEALLEDGGTPPTRFAAISLSKFAFWPWLRSIL
jgi:hypothetical protein